MAPVSQSTLRRHSVVQRVVELDSVSDACRIMGDQRDTYFEISRASRRSWPSPGIDSASNWFCETMTQPTVLAPRGDDDWLGRHAGLPFDWSAQEIQPRWWVRERARSSAIRPGRTGADSC